MLYCFRRSKDKSSFSVSYVFEKNGILMDVVDKSKTIPLTDVKFEEPFLLWDPEYTFSPVYDKRYPVVLGDWNLNSYIFLQNIDKFSIIFSDEVGSSYLSGRVPSRVIGLPIFVLYVDVIERDDVKDLLKSKNIDVLFVGNLNPGIHSRRNRLLKKILTLPENYRVAVVCGLRDKKLYSEALSRSKIVFNHSIEKGMNMRVFETLKSGSCLFLEDDNIQTWRYLKKFEHAVPYTDSEIFELIKKYLSDDEARERITIEGYEKIKTVTKDSVYRRILQEIKSEDTFSKYNKSIYSEIASFRSFVNDVFNFFVVDEKILSYAESWAFSLAEKVDRYTKSSLLSDLAFLYMVSVQKYEYDKRKLLEKAFEYLNSSLNFDSNSLIIWYNSAFLHYSAGNEKEFLESCSRFFRIIREFPTDESMHQVRGYPEIFSPIIFSIFSILKSYIDRVWIENFDNTYFLRNEIIKALSAQIYVFLCNFFLERQDFKEAEKFCHQALKLFNNLVPAYYTLGKIYLGMKRFKDAASVYLKAYNEEPFFFQYWIEVLTALYLSGDKQGLDEIIKEMKLISSRVYLYNGSGFSINFGEEEYSFNLRSVQDFIKEYIST